MTKTISRQEALKQAKFVVKKNKPHLESNTKSGVQFEVVPYYPYSIWNNGRKVLQIEPNIKQPREVAKNICKLLNENKQYKLIVE